MSPLGSVRRTSDGGPMDVCAFSCPAPRCRHRPARSRSDAAQTKARPKGARMEPPALGVFGISPSPAGGVPPPFRACKKTSFLGRDSDGSLRNLFETTACEGGTGTPAHLLLESIAAGGRNTTGRVGTCSNTTGSTWSGTTSDGGCWKSILRRDRDSRPFTNLQSLQDGRRRFRNCGTYRRSHILPVWRRDSQNRRHPASRLSSSAHTARRRAPSQATCGSRKTAKARPSPARKE